jgi:cytochrome b561
MPLKDTATGYGWISIVLHWITAVIILYMLYLGNTIEGLAGEERSAAVLRHTSIAITFYCLFLARIVWRLYYGHPRPTEEQRGWAFTLGKWTHLAMVFALAVMLVSGPLMHWSYGNPIEVFDWFAIPAPIGSSMEFAAMMHAAHKLGAAVLFFGFILHIGGVYKHTAFNQDGTLAKMILADRQSTDIAADDSGRERAGGTVE